MKTKSIIISLILITSASLFYNFKAKPDQEKAETIILTAFHSFQSKYSNIFIYYGDGRVENVAMEEYSDSPRSPEPGIKTLTSTLNKLNQQGYTIVSANETFYGDTRQSKYTIILHQSN